MSEEKKVQSEEKKYAQISRDFIRHCGDVVGLPSISGDLTVLLSEDVNYRLREAVQTAGQFMRHAKRKKLTNEDFNNAMRCSDVEPIFGYSSTDPLRFIYVKDAEVFCPEDNEIDLVLMAGTRQAYENPGVPAIRAQWLAVEGVPKGNSSSNSGNKNGVVIPSVSEDLMSYYNQVTKAILGNNEEVTKVALNDLKRNSKISPLLPFFINFVSVGVKKVSHDLTQLTKLLNTVLSITNNPYLYLGPRPYLKLLVQGVIYCIVEPLAASLNPINDHWALRDYAARLLAHIVRIWHTPVNQLYDQTLKALKDVFTDLTKPFCSHYGAVIAMMALGPEPVWQCLYPNLSNYWPHLTNALEDVSRSNVPFKSDAQKVYGALLLASEFLVLDIHRMFFSKMDELEDLRDEGKSRVAEDLIENAPNLHKSSVSATTEPLDLNECVVKQEETAIKQEMEVAPVNEPSSSVPCSSTAVVSDSPRIAAYQQLYECFGDALAARLPYFLVKNYYKPRKRQLINLFNTPETLQTGEELLEAFNVKEEEVQSNSMEDDHYSYEDHDENSSDDGEVEPEQTDVDLRIKSTVSDPIQGIKLTITKLPRTQPVVAEPAKVTKLSIKISKEQLVQPVVPEPPPTPLPPPEEPVRDEEHDESGPFEVVRFQPPCVYIEFNFEGSMPIPSHKLRRKLPGGHPFYHTTFSNDVHKISLKLKKAGKLRKKTHLNPEQKFALAFRTGDVLSFL